MSGERVPVAKTWKLFVGGAFVRSEGGHVLAESDAHGAFAAHYARATRKDLRDAVVAARAAQAGWARRSAFNRSLILFRFAEMLEDRRATFEHGLVALLGRGAAEARAELSAAVDRAFAYAGWCDKLAQTLGNVNPVASPYLSFSVPEPTGVVGVVAPPSSPVLGLVTALLPVLVPGNTAVVVLESAAPSLSLALGEVLATSDVPPGVVNLLSGLRAELVPHLAGHRDVNALACHGGSVDERAALEREAADSVKRVRQYEDRGREGWLDAEHASPWRIEPFVEWKTTWHPLGV